MGDREDARIKAELETVLKNIDTILEKIQTQDPAGKDASDADRNAPPKPQS